MSSEKRPNVLLVSDAVGYGGAEYYMGSLYEKVDRSRFRVSLLCDEKAAWPDRFSHENIIRTGFPHDRSLVRQVLQTRMVAFHSIRKFSKLYQTIAPDIIHFNQPGLPDNVIPILAAKLMKKKVVTTLHLPHLPNQTSLRSGLVRTPLTAFMVRIIGNIPRIFVSQASCDLFCHNFPKSVNKNIVIYSGIDPVNPVDPAERAVLKARRWGASGDVLGFISRLDVEKGLDIFIEAVAALLRNGLKVRALIVGDGPVRKRCEQLSQKLGIADYLRWTGWQTQPLKFMDEIDVFVFPTSREGLPYVILEAMAKGIPVVATAVDGVPEAIEDGMTGFLVYPRSAEAFFEKVKMVLTTPDLAQNMGDRGRERVRNLFTINKWIHTTMGLYDLLLGKNLNEGYRKGDTEGR